MTLDTGTILTAVFFLLLCIIPFILLNISHRKRVKQNLQLLNREAGKYQVSVNTFNTWGNTSIGMDENANVIFFTKKTADGDTAQLVALTETEKCRIANIKRTESDGDHHYSLTEKLELVFESRDKKKAETALAFFDIEHDGGMLTGELQMAEKWCNIINHKIAAANKK
ncbi:MAG: hypothetical protein ACKOU7_10310 [Ferruginibacter sp.]